MTGALKRIGINAGEKTELRDITAPRLGENYIESYYEMLSSIETDTIHTYDDVDSLPEPQYDSLVAIAPSTTDGVSSKSLYVYDGNKWNDTAAPIGDLINEVDRLQARVTELEDTDFQITSYEFPSTVKKNQSRDYKATIKNDGEIDGTQTVKLVTYPTGKIASKDVELSKDGTEKQITITHTFIEKDTKSVRIETDNDSTIFRTVDITE